MHNIQRFTTIRNILLISILALFSLVMLAPGVQAQTPDGTTSNNGTSSQTLTDAACEGITAIGGECTDQANSTSGISDILKNLVNALLFLVGAASVVVMIIAGLRFIFSNGDAQQAASARNTILYAVIGIIVAVLAWGIVNFVIGAIDNGSPTSSSTNTQPNSGGASGQIPEGIDL